MSILKHFNIFILFLALNNSVLSNNHDSSFYAIHKKKLCFTLPITSKFLVLKIKDGATGNQLNLMPSPNIMHGFDIHTDYFGLSVTPPFLNYRPREDLFGKSEFRDIQINLYPKKFVLDLTLQIYSGYFLRNTRQYKELNSDEFSIHQDIKTQSGSLNFYYVLNHKKFTFAGPFLFSASQLKSAGSFIIGTSAAGIYYSSKKGILNPLIETKFSDENKILSGNAYHFTINFGYGHTFVFKKNYHLSASLIPGFGLCNIYNKQKDYSITFYPAKPTFHLNYRIGAGYDNGNWYAGIYAIIHELYFFGIEKSTLQYNMVKSKLYIGKRIDVSKIQDKIESFFMKAEQNN